MLLNYHSDRHILKSYDRILYQNVIYLFIQKFQVDLVHRHQAHHLTHIFRHLVEISNNLKVITEVVCSHPQISMVHLSNSHNKMDLAVVLAAPHQPEAIHHQADQQVEKFNCFISPQLACNCLICKLCGFTKSKKYKYSVYLTTNFIVNFPFAYIWIQYWLAHVKF